MSISNDTVSKSFGESVAPKLKIEEVFKITPYKTYYIIQYLSNKIARKLLDSKFSYNLIAPMNSGKTKIVIDEALKSKHKTIILCPLQVNVLEIFQNEGYKNKDIYFLMGKDGSNNSIQIAERNNGKNILNSKVILSVYDSLGGITKHTGFNAKAYNLIIDEAHNFVSAYNYRFESIRYAAELAPTFRKVIYITGTPEGYSYINKCKTILFKRKEEAPRLNFNIVQFNGGYKEIICAYIKQHGIEQDISKKIIIFIENIEEVKNTCEMIKRKFSKMKVVELNSGEKDGEDFQYIFKERSLDKDAQCFVTTSVISDGLNIHTHVHSVFLINSAKFMTNRQLLARFREGIDNAFLFYNPRQNREVALFSDYQQAYLEQEKHYIKILNEFNNICRVNQKFQLTEISNLLVDSNLLYITDNNFRFSKEALAYLLFNHFERSVHKDMRRIEDYYKFYAKYNVKSMDFEEFQAEFLNGVKPDFEDDNLSGAELINKRYDFISDIAQNGIDKQSAPKNVIMLFEKDKSIKKMKDKFAYFPKNIFLTLYCARKKSYKTADSFLQKFDLYCRFLLITEFDEIKSLKQPVFSKYKYIVELNELLSSPVYRLSKTNNINGKKIVNELNRKYKQKYDEDTAVQSIVKTEDVHNKKLKYRVYKEFSHIDFTSYFGLLNNFKNKYNLPYDIEPERNRLEDIPYHMLLKDLKSIAKPDSKIRELLAKVQSRIMAISSNAA